MADTLKRSIDDLQQQINRNRLRIVDAIKSTGIELPRSKRSAPSKDQLDALSDVASKRTADALEAQSRFRDAFKRVTSLDIAGVNKANVAGLAESQCKQALLLACKMACDANGHHRRENTISTAYKAHATFLEWMFAELTAEALKFAIESEELRRGELKALQAQSGKLLSALEAAQSALRHQLECEAKLRKVEDDSWDLRKRLAEASMELASLRRSTQELSHKLGNAVIQLESSATKGTQLESEVDELQEKLRCSICMDRPKDTVFACGHTCCGECASEWKKCYYNCQSERRQKPVKYSFGIYL